jgi:hypothetical protein
MSNWNLANEARDGFPCESCGIFVGCRLYHDGQEHVVICKTCAEDGSIDKLSKERNMDFSPCGCGG